MFCTCYRWQLTEFLVSLVASVKVFSFKTFVVSFCLFLPFFVNQSINLPTVVHSFAKRLCHSFKTQDIFRAGSCPLQSAVSAASSQAGISEPAMTTSRLPCPATSRRNSSLLKVILIDSDLGFLILILLLISVMDVFLSMGHIYHESWSMIHRQKNTPNTNMKIQRTQI